MSDYITPRKKHFDETEKERLMRRLEEYIEYAHAAKRFADIGFYEELLRYLETKS